MPIDIIPILQNTSIEELNPLENEDIYQYVVTFNSRKGIVLPLADDYTATMIGNDSGVAGAYVSDALDWLNANTQPVDATLTSLSALGTVADRIAYTTAVDTWAETPLTAFARTVIDDVDAPTARATLDTTGGRSGLTLNVLPIVDANGDLVDSVISDDGSGNITINGTLDVTGTTTTFDSTVVAIGDSMMKFAKDNTATDIIDIGWYGVYGATPSYSGLFRDATDGVYKLYKDLTVEPGTTVNTGGAGYALADLTVGSIVNPDKTQYRMAYWGASGVLTESSSIVTDASGNLGVGVAPITATQTGSVTANGIIAAKGYLAAHKTSCAIIEHNFNTDITAIRSYGATASTGVIAFRTGGGGDSTDSEAARITSTGALLINTATTLTAGAAKLEVAGSVYTNNTDFIGQSIYRTTAGGAGLEFGNSIGVHGQINGIGGQGGLQFRTDTEGGTPAVNMTLSASGDLGIGVAPTLGKLHVAGDAITTGLYVSANGLTNQYTRLTGTVDPQLIFMNGDTESMYLQCLSVASGGRALRIYDQTAAAERMRITSTGALLINTATTLTAGAAKLEVNGDVYAAGDVGIGVTPSSFALEISKAGNAGAIKITNTTDSSIIYLNPAITAGVPGLQTGTNHPIGFAINNAEKARITAAGALLIGTATTLTAGAAKLEVAGDVYAAGDLNLGDGGPRSLIGPLNNDLKIIAKPNGADEGILFYVDGGTTPASRFNLSGALLIGATSPTASELLHVAGDVYATGFYDCATAKGLKVNGTQVVTDQQTALTAQLTTITHTAPGVADYALQDMTNTSPYGFVTQDEANTLLSVVANLQTRVSELESKLQTHGLIA